AGQLADVRKDLNDQYRIFEDDAFARLERLLEGKIAAGGPSGLRSGIEVSRDYLSGIQRERWFEIRMRDEEVNQQLETVQSQLKAQREVFDGRYQEKKAKITAGDDLAPGVLKMVKVYLAVKRRVQP